VVPDEFCWKLFHAACWDGNKVEQCHIILMLKCVLVCVDIKMY